MLYLVSSVTLSTQSVSLILNQIKSFITGYNCQDGLCKKLYLSSKTFDAARRQCEEDGAQLAVIHSWKDFNLVQLAMLYHNQKKVWIGAKTDLEGGYNFCCGLWPLISVK